MRVIVRGPETHISQPIVSFSINFRRVRGRRRTGQTRLNTIVLPLFGHSKVSPRIGSHVHLRINLSGTLQPSLTVAKAAEAPTIDCVVFLQATFDFIVIAFVPFIAVKQVNRFKKEARPATPTGLPPSATPATKFPTMRKWEDSHDRWPAQFRRRRSSCRHSKPPS